MHYLSKADKKMIGVTIFIIKLFNNTKDNQFNDKDLERLANKKIGRNEPCPCGSGKKFKHCCGAL